MGSFDQDVAELDEKIARIQELAVEAADLYEMMSLEERGVIDDVPEKFEVFRTRDSSGFDDLIADFDAAINALTTEHIEAVTHVGEDLTEWEGQTADSFRINVLEDFETRTTNQLNIIIELKGGTEAAKEIVDTARADSMMIADYTIDALEQYIEDNSGGGENLLQVLGVVATVAAAVAATATGVGAAALSVGLVMAGGSMSAVGSQQKVEVSGISASEILDSMAEELAKLRRSAYQEEVVLAETLRDDVAAVDEGLGECVIHPRPLLAESGKIDIEDFRPG